MFSASTLADAIEWKRTSSSRLSDTRCEKRIPYDPVLARAIGPGEAASENLIRTRPRNFIVANPSAAPCHRIAVRTFVITYWSLGNTSRDITGIVSRHGVFRMKSYSSSGRRAYGFILKMRRNLSRRDFARPSSGIRNISAHEDR